MAADTLILYDRTGAAIAYTLEDGETLYTYGGRPVGYIHEERIFTFQGKMLGWYLDGWVLDFDGTRAFFTKDSKGGPSTPIKGIQPIRGIRQFCPARERSFPQGLKPAFSLKWSPRSGGIFFGEAAFTGVRYEAPKPARAKAADGDAEATGEAPAAEGAAPAAAKEEQGAGPAEDAAPEGD